ncbi:MAG: type VI secretion system-associated FHA domain protein TagH [Reyranella sp.]|uniref:type VI secretion system-associated FHA domain protein TagH n=2 Tax=Reyranella sp. TaxID=1929291 RepID=UPI003D153352
MAADSLERNSPHSRMAAAPEAVNRARRAGMPGARRPNAIAQRRVPRLEFPQSGPISRKGDADRRRFPPATGVSPHVSLMLVTIRCPDNVAPERREVHGGEFSIGRGRDSDWVVADPERHLSKRHCRLVYEGGDWELQDLSTNGTFVNQSGDPIGKGASQKLRHGDRIKFGLYEIEVVLDEGRSGAVPADHDRFLTGTQRDDFALRAPSPGQEGRSPFGGQAVFGDQRAGGDHGAFGDRDAFGDKGVFGDQRGDRAFGDERLSGPIAPALPPESPILPPDFDPLAPIQEPFTGPTTPDHAPALSSAFRPPTPAAVIPDDWDVALPSGAPPPQAPRPQPAAAPPAAPPPQQQQQPEPAPAPARRAAPDTALAAAFLRGAGLSEATLADPEKSFERLGGAMRATVSGLRQTLMARASIKDEFRIEQTMIRPSGNNPLKFSLDDDDAMNTLLGLGRRGSMPPEEAIREAFEDLRLHELATVAAMQAAVRFLLAQLDPEAVERKTPTSALDIHPAQKRARAWETFVQQHRSITRALSDDFDSVFGKAFARAYEEAIEKLTNEGTPP